jgi:hypothetical protein
MGRTTRVPLSGTVVDQDERLSVLVRVLRL